MAQLAAGTGAKRQSSLHTLSTVSSNILVGVSVSLPSEAET